MFIFERQKFHISGCVSGVFSLCELCIFVSKSCPFVRLVTGRGGNNHSIYVSAVSFVEFHEAQVPMGRPRMYTTAVSMAGTGNWARNCTSPRGARPGGSHVAGKE